MLALSSLLHASLLKWVTAAQQSCSVCSHANTHINNDLQRSERRLRLLLVLLPVNYVQLPVQLNRSSTPTTTEATTDLATSQDDSTGM